jgi:NADPH-dependent 2,4-dienoyl-CoA reductase/sulfur reductase-like enzyme/rhodanese-related sulfurtransferase
VALRVVVVGAVALGPKVACRLRRLLPDAEITVVDQDRHISYGGCGIPYYVADEVPDESELRRTSFQALRDVPFFRDAKGVNVRTRVRAASIDRARRVLVADDLESGAREELPYDRLVLATGSVGAVPPVPGRELGNVFVVHNLQNAMDLKRALIAEEIRHAVVVGGGAIGLEVTEALADTWNLATTVIERLGHLLPQLFDANIAGIVEATLRAKGVAVHTGESLLRLEGEGGKVARVVTDRRTLPAELVVVATGVRPNVALGRDAGLATGALGGFVVNEHLQTSDPAIYAGGDCVECRSLVTGEPVYAPLGSLANRQGRVIADHIAGKPARFDGAVGSFIVKVFDAAFAAAGPTQERAIAAGFDAERVLAVGYDRAHFMPTKAVLVLQLVVDRATRRVLGFQGAGPASDALLARVDAVAAVLRHGPTVEDIGTLELAYSPPFASAMDTLNALGNTAGNLLDGLYRRMTAGEALEALRDPASDVLFLDLNAPRAAAPYLARHPGRWANIPYEQLAARLGELPRERTIVTLCDSGIRSYESQVLLAARGFPRAFALEGGYNLLRRLGIDLLAGCAGPPTGDRG